MPAKEEKEDRRHEGEMEWLKGLALTLSVTKNFSSKFRIEFNDEIFEFVVCDVCLFVYDCCEMLVLMLEKHSLLVAMMV